nr:kinetochore protein Nuf2-like isoform X1 [Ipomoea batatas]
MSKHLDQMQAIQEQVNSVKSIEKEVKVLKAKLSDEEVLDKSLEAKLVERQGKADQLDEMRKQVEKECALSREEAAKELNNVKTEVESTRCGLELRQRQVEAVITEGDAVTAKMNSVRESGTAKCEALRHKLEEVVKEFTKYSDSVSDLLQRYEMGPLESPIAQFLFSKWYGKRVPQLRTVQSQSQAEVLRTATVSLGGGGRGDLILPAPIGGGTRPRVLDFPVPVSPLVNPAAESMPAPVEAVIYSWMNVNMTILITGLTIAGLLLVPDERVLAAAVLDLQHEVPGRVENRLDGALPLARMHEASSEELAGVGILEPDLAAFLAGHHAEPAGPDLVGLKPLAALVAAAGGARRDFENRHLTHHQERVLERLLVLFKRHRFSSQQRNAV